MRPVAYVTGASGFLGSRLARELVKRDWEVHVLLRETSSRDEIENLRLHHHVGDITDAGSLARSVPEGADAVFHVAASTNIWSARNREQEAINVAGTRNVVDAARTAGVRRFIHTSSFTTWGFQETVIDETSPRTDATDWINYVRTKHLAEQCVMDAVQRGRIDAVILNPGHILGPGDKNNWSRVIALADQEKLPGVPPGSGPFADVREVARAHISAFEKGRTGEKYLLGGPRVTFHEVVQITGQMLGKRVPKKPTPAWLLHLAARVYAIGSAVTGREPVLTPEAAAMITQNLMCDSSRAERELDYGYTDVRTLLQDTIDWMRETRRLKPSTVTP